MMVLRGASRLNAALATSLCLLGGCATTGRGSPGPITQNARYVAMGSSYAAGPGIMPAADQPPTRCARSAANYPHLLARKLDLRLVDVSCSGATTAHLLGRWNELPPQLDAVTPDTRLVTVTIGGNDVAYVGRLGSASCRTFASPPPGTPGGACPDAPVVTEATWARLDTAMREIAAEVHRRAPAARLIFVEYLSVLPPAGACAAIPLPPGQADESRATLRRLAALTERVARQSDSAVLKITAPSERHGPCAADPWMTGFPLPGAKPFVPYHPNARGMAAMADALARQIGTTRAR